MAGMFSCEAGTSIEWQDRPSNGAVKTKAMVCSFAQGVLQDMRLALLQDQSLKLWDLRMRADALRLDSINSSSNPRTVDCDQTQRHAVTNKRPKAGAPGCIATFTGHTEPVSGFALHQGDVIAHAGGHLGVLSLNGPPYTETFVPTRLSNTRGGKDSASLVGLDILPHSRLLVAGAEDGVIKVCH